jgi:hypothetical protein
MSSYYAKHRADINRKNVDRFDAIRAAVLSVLGTMCSECGEAEPEFLSVDHVGNDRKSERSSSSLTWKSDIVSGRVDLSRYQVLCRNCNESKQRLNPVQLVKEKEVVGRMKACTSCLLEKDLGEFYKRDSRTRKSASPICTRFGLTVTTVRCYELLGGSCSCCGLKNFSMLNMDHVRNDGAERRKLGERTGVWTCRQVLNGGLPAGSFQLLCSNCNYSKTVGNGVCVHSRALNEGSVRS